MCTVVLCSNHYALKSRNLHVLTYVFPQLSRFFKGNSMQFLRNFLAIFKSKNSNIRASKICLSCAECKNSDMAVIKQNDIMAGENALHEWKDAAEALISSGENAATINPPMARKDRAMAVRYSLHMMTIVCPGDSVELRIAPYAAVKILEGPKSDPHNLTPPDVIELAPDVWLRMVCGFTTWSDERNAGNITAIGERDDLSPYLPLPVE